SAQTKLCYPERCEGSRIFLPCLKFSPAIKNIHKLIALGSDCEKINVGIEANAVKATGCGFW
ncbi:MAG: hypothetical protein WBQ36_02700, partial [Desulfobaccales bacterium]